MTPDTYVIREPFEVSEQHMFAGQPKLTVVQLREVNDITRAIAEQFGYPVDIEWAYEDDTLYALQARPITTL